ncbi:peptidase S14 [Bosea sp. ASV33]|uniref:peptidase S14 n=1 Tax=Bosea sp. ASV33 TaxID=2795106 RepID=UPI0020BE40A8|nr:peptidase S14 [Bosea sp. ASV33]
MSAPPEGIIVIELSTLGGDPEVARMMGEDVRFHSEQEPGRRFVFLGKTAIYSAGATFMSFFARPNRYLTRGTRLMVHERKIQTNITLDGPLTMCIANLKAKLNEIEHSIQIQNEGFQNLISGSSVTMDQVLKLAPENWYIEANEAKNLGLIEGVI